MLTAVEAAKEIAAKRGAAAEYGAGGATSKLGDAVRQENDEFIASQSDQQALLMRYVMRVCNMVVFMCATWLFSWCAVWCFDLYSTVHKARRVCFCVQGGGWV